MLNLHAAKNKGPPDFSDGPMVANCIDQISSIAKAVASPPPMQSDAKPRFFPWR
jgi:hypothetical protein